MKFIKPIFFFLFTLALSSFADRSAENDCIGPLREIFRRMSLNDLPKDDKVYYFDYSVKTALWDNSVPPSDTHVKVYLSNDHVEITSAQMEVYQDKLHSFTVIPMRKMIYWGDSRLPGKDSSGIKNQDMSVLKDKVFDNATVKYCRDVTEESNYNKELLLEPKQDLKNSTKISSVKFLYNTKKRTIYKTIIQYLKGSPQQSVEVTYFTVDYDHKKHGLNYSSKSKIFKSDNMLLSRYQGYEVMDVRANKK